MKLECDVIRDLLPLYAEKLASHASSALVDKDAAFTVHQCLHALEEPYKEVFSLRVFGELPFDRIGAIFGHNAAWARVTYYRAKTRIQTMLEQQK